MAQRDTPSRQKRGSGGDSNTSTLRFVPRDASGLPQKRAGQRACESCRKRKRRCEHLNDLTSPSVAGSQPLLGSPEVKRVRFSAQPDVNLGRGDVFTEDPGLAAMDPGEDQAALQRMELSVTSTSPATADTAIESSSTGHHAAAASHLPEASEPDESDDDARFIGHLNPEGTFLVAASPTLTTGSGEPQEVGVWLSEKGRNGKRKRYSALPTTNNESNALYCSNALMSKVLLPHLEESCLSLLPDPIDFQSLSAIYFDEIHPMFPILDRNQFEGPCSHPPSRVVLSQAVCIMASSSSDAKPFLRLSINGARAELERKEFARQLSLALRTSLSLGMVKDKLTLCQIYGLLSMSMQLADDGHDSAEMCARAVAYAQTLGLHLLIDAGQENSETYSRVFCCVWALDRLNAAFHGRPVTIHERDFGIDLQAKIRAQEGCFQLFLRIVLLLDKVIDLYRPKATATPAEWEAQFPDFEALVEEAGALRVKHNLLATVETFYHAVAMLACRSQSLLQLQRWSPSYVRQNLSAFRVISTVADQSQYQLSRMPMVPYAVSLALRFFYREFRFTKVPLFRGRAQKQLVIGCGILRTLGDTFVVAASIADLVERTLNETDKVYSSLVQSQEPERSRTVMERQNPVPVELSNSDFSIGAHTASIDWSLWDTMPEFDIFQHFDPNFDLNAIDAALTDDTQPLFPITFDGFNI